MSPVLLLPTTPSNVTCQRCNQSGRDAGIIKRLETNEKLTSKLKELFQQFAKKTTNFTIEIRKCRLTAKQILLETPSASYFALHLRTNLHHYE